MSRPPILSSAHLAAAQGLYYLVTGLWPILHLESFLVVTGPKASLWLVQTVGALVTAIALALLAAAAMRDRGWTVVVLGGASALAFLLVDVVFYTHGILRAVYLADAAVEGLLFVAWTMVTWRRLARTTRGVPT